MAVEVKICGLTNVEDACAALDAGADYLGFVLYPESPRGIPASRLSEILDALDRPCKAVGVFVNAPRDEVERIARDAGLYAVQLHGDEPAEDFVDFPITIWRAVHVDKAGASPDPESWPAARYVVDAALPGLYGGTGTPADWEQAARIAAAYPAMLAGGLTPETVAEAVRTVHPLGVDVSSGVEASPGRKDLTKVRAFIETVSRLDTTRSTR